MIGCFETMYMVPLLQLPLARLDLNTDGASLAAEYAAPRGMFSDLHKVMRLLLCLQTFQECWNAP